MKHLHLREAHHVCELPYDAGLKIPDGVYLPEHGLDAVLSSHHELDVPAATCHGGRGQLSQRNDLAPWQLFDSRLLRRDLL